MLNTNELLELEDSLKEVFEVELTPILTKLNRTGKLKEFLSLIDQENLYPGYTSSYKPYGTGKIIIVGASEVKELNLVKTAESLGIDRDRLEFCLDYDEASRYDFKKTYYQPKYSLIIVGPMHHSGYEKGQFGSVISAIENTEGYPPVVRTGTNDLKITKSGIKATLENCISKGLITI